MSPVPVAASPIDGVSFVQVNVVVGVALVNVTAVVSVFAHIVSSGTVLVRGIGFTVIVKVLSGPIQPFGPVGVTVIVATTGPAVAFKPVNEAIFPVPVAANPIDGVSFVQANVVPAVALVKVTAVVAVLAQST